MVLLVAKYVFRPDLREKLPEILSLLREVADRRTALEVLLCYVVRATEKFDERDVNGYPYARRYCFVNLVLKSS